MEIYNNAAGLGAPSHLRIPPAIVPVLILRRWVFVGSLSFSPQRELHDRRFLDVSPLRRPQPNQSGGEDQESECGLTPDHQGRRGRYKDRDLIHGLLARLESQGAFYPSFAVQWFCQVFILDLLPRIIRVGVLDRS